MKTQSYYRDMTIVGCDIRSEGEPLQLNCAGIHSDDRPIAQHNVSGRQDFYLQYVTKGRLTVHSFGESQELTPGMFLIYRPRTPYRYEVLPGDTLTYFWAHFTGFHAGRLLSNLGVETNRLYRTEGGERQNARIIGEFGRLFAEFVHRRPGFDEASAAILSGILVQLARGADKAAAGPMRKLESVSYLHRHFREEVRVSELAAMEHLSESRYRTVFRFHTGMSPGDYRTALRLQYACHQLTLTDRTVTEIAADCGYSDPLYFMRIFRLKKNMTPGEYRERARQGE